MGASKELAVDLFGLADALEKVEGNKNLFSTLFKFYYWLGNTISGTTKDEEEGDINMNLDCVVPLFYLVRIVLRLFTEVAVQEKGKIRFDWSSAPTQKLLILDY